MCFFALLAHFIVFTSLSSMSVAQPGWVRGVYNITTEPTGKWSVEHRQFGNPRDLSPPLVDTLHFHTVMYVGNLTEVSFIVFNLQTGVILFLG